LRRFVFFDDAVDSGRLFAQVAELPEGFHPRLASPVALGAQLVDESF
jgi:hypothetical protein